MDNWLKKHNNSSNRGSQDTAGNESIGHIRGQKFNFIPLSIATNGFRDEIMKGQGGSQSVFKGQLDNGQDIIVKRLRRRRREQQFDIDVKMLSRVHHPNLVTLIGFYAHSHHEFLLVYPCMRLGTLGDHIYNLPQDKHPLDWNTRMKITIGIARGIEYLHDRTDPPLICRNLNSSNVLLRDGYNPVIWEFSPEVEETRLDTFIMEKNGYLAPEYNVDSHHNSMSDVYSFGVILLEIVFGRKAVDPTFPSAESNLVEWVINTRNIVVERQLDDFPKKEVKYVIAIIRSCLVTNPPHRPSIKEIISVLTELEAYEPESIRGYLWRGLRHLLWKKRKRYIN